MENTKNVAQNNHEIKNTNLFITSQIKIILSQPKPQINSSQRQVKNLQTLRSQNPNLWKSRILW